MEIEFEQCKITGKEVDIILHVTGVFDLLKDDIRGKNRYESPLLNLCRTTIAEQIAKEYLIQHKMDIINSLKKEDILNAIQLKIIENFSISNR